jgi:hypothetical protein
MHVMFLSSVLVGLTLAQPLIRLRRPRPSLRAVVRQSGFVVCVTVIVATLVIIDLEWGGLIRPSALTMLGISLVLLWPILGRGVGLGWIVASASGAAAAYL